MSNSLIYNIDNLPDAGKYYQIDSQLEKKDFDKLSPPNGQTFKVIFIGDAFVGKTTLIGCMKTNTYQQDYYATVGCAFIPIDCKLNNHEVKLHIWDTAGAENHNTFVKQYYRSSNFACVCFSYDNLSSFNHVASWLDNLNKNTGDELNGIFLVGCKSDLQHKVSEDLIQDLCLKNKLEYFETSSLKKYGVTNFVKRICHLGVLINSDQSQAKKIVISDTVDLEEGQKQNENQEGCKC